MRISEAARALDCSVLTIRHYHQQGVVPEPERKANGYRDYSLADLAALVKVRQMVLAGVPIKSLIGDPEDALYDVALTEIERRVANLEEQRARLVRLRENPPGSAPHELMVLMKEVLAESGLSEAEIAQEVDAWNLMAYSGVATAQTWHVLKTNLNSPQCISKIQRQHQLWKRLGETEPGPECDELAERWFKS
ncbi:MerR family transcriptional regulator [Corynebacterium striatum]